MSNAFLAERPSSSTGRRTAGLTLVACLASTTSACRIAADRGTVPDRPIQIAVGAAASAPRSDAGAERDGPRYGIAATIGGHGRVFPLPNGDVVFTSRGYFFRLGSDGAIDLLGELDVERRGIEVANFVDAVVNVSGTATALRVETKRGHFASGFRNRMRVLGPTGFTTVARFRTYELETRVGDAVVALDAPVPADASPLDPERWRGKLVVVSGARATPALPSDSFIVTSLAGTAEGELFAIGKELADEGPLMEAPDTLLAWRKDATTPVTVPLPAPTPRDSDRVRYEVASRPVVLARRETEVWVAGPDRRLLHGDAAGMIPVVVPSGCGEIFGAWLGPGERLTLLCVDPASRAMRLVVVFERAEDGRFSSIPLPDRSAATYTTDLRTVFYAAPFGLTVDVERGTSVGTDDDGDLHVSAGFARGGDDAWLVAHDREDARTLLLRKGARGPVRSLDHELAVHENDEPAPIATPACPGVLVSFGESTPALFDRVKKAFAGEWPTTILRGRVHDEEHVGIFVIGLSDKDAFTNATSVAQRARAKGLAPKLFCRRPVVTNAAEIDWPPPRDVSRTSSPPPKKPPPTR